MTALSAAWLNLFPAPTSNPSCLYQVCRHDDAELCGTVIGSSTRLAFVCIVNCVLPSRLSTSRKYLRMSKVDSIVETCGLFLQSSSALAVGAARQNGCARFPAAGWEFSPPRIPSAAAPAPGRSCRGGEAVQPSRRTAPHAPSVHTPAAADLHHGGPSWTSRLDIVKMIIIADALKFTSVNNRLTSWFILILLLLFAYL